MPQGGELELSLPPPRMATARYAPKMNRSRSRRFTGGAMVAAGVASIVLSNVSLSGLAGHADGDLMATPLNALTLVTLLVGVLTLLRLELAHIESRGATHDVVARATGQPSPGRR